LCTAHLLRVLDDAAQVYPDRIWPVQIADALRALIGEANRAREQGLAAIPDDVCAAVVRPLTRPDPREENFLGEASA
jgi:transposase